MSETESFDPVWDEKYQQGHAQYYPWDHIVSFIYRYSPKDKSRKDINILEVGCGTASNLWFAAREGFQAFGLDASDAAISFAKKRFSDEKLNADFQVGDFTKLPYSDNTFDVVIDRAAITCCGFSDASKAVSEVNRVLTNNGKFIFNPYSKENSSFHSGQHFADGIVKEISAGTLQNTGQICFYDQQDIEKLFADHWHFLSMQHLSWEERFDNDDTLHAEWRVVLEKVL